MPLLFLGRNRVTSGFRLSDRPDHNGIDIVGDDSTDILCTINGTVRSSTIITNKNDPTWEWGNYVRVDDAQGRRHYFCHMASRSVRVGQKVKIGDKLGVMGYTGYTIPNGPGGAHTHYEVRTANNKTKLNPVDFLGIPNAKGTYTAKTGWEQDGANWYYYSAGEKLKSRWFKDADGYWYYLGKDGAMLTGIQKIDGKLYMLNPKRAHDIPTGACIITDTSGAIE